jgi:hypothetical protein
MDLQIGVLEAMPCDIGCRTFSNFIVAMSLRKPSIHSSSDQYDGYSTCACARGSQHAAMIIMSGNTTHGNNTKAQRAEREHLVEEHIGCARHGRQEDDGLHDVPRPVIVELPRNVA